ncbi:MAG: RNB domain-containing ribonuclease [Pseudomonadota bacterium]
MATTTAITHDDLLSLAARHDVQPDYPPSVLSAATAWNDDPGINDPTLVDLTNLPFVTIDNEDSRDLDQAVWVGDGRQAKAPDAQFCVFYALADASHYVRPGEPLFDEALRRGASFYLPGLAIPMLPRSLSEGLISLNPNVDRRSMVMCIGIDASGEVTDSRIERARIRSRAKLSYVGVQAVLDGDQAPALPEGVASSLRNLVAVGERRLARAEERDIVRYRRTEVMVKASDGNDRFVVLNRPRLAIEKYNEQISLLANIEGARFLAEAAAHNAIAQPIFRVHPDPGRDRLRGFASLLKTLTEAHRLPEDPWRWRPGGPSSLADYLDALPSGGPAGAIAKAIHRQALLLNYRSEFTPTPGPHYGVGAAVYGRFSAPMREVVGIFTHKETWEALRSTATHRPADLALRDNIVDRANEAKRVQSQLTREANKLILDQLLAVDRQNGTLRTGTVVGISRKKVHVSLDDPPIDVKVYFAHLGEGVRMRDDVTAGDETTTVCALGDRVSLEVVGLEREHGRERWRFGLRLTNP